MRTTFFISDLHLDASRPAINALFVRFLMQRAGNVEALYVLGDLFEYWVGDDQPLGELEAVVAALKTLAESGCRVYFVHGNRDFLLGERLAARAGMTLLPESSVIELYGTPVLIMHGDTLCTDDADYQRLRLMLRNPQWQALTLAMPLQQRLQEALRLRQMSREMSSTKSDAITDVNADTVDTAMRASAVRTLIHGHTHRPAIHRLQLDGAPAQRIVLGDWYAQGSVLSVEESGAMRLQSLSAEMDGGAEDVAVSWLQ